MASSTKIGIEADRGEPRIAPIGAPAADLADAIDRGVSHLLSLQAEGYWLGELEADTTLESDYIFYLHVLGKAEPRVSKLANYVRRRQ